MSEDVKSLIEKKARRYVEIDSERWVDYGEIVRIGEPLKREDIVASLIDKAPNTGFHIFRDEIMCRALRAVGVKGKIVANLIQYKSETNILRTTIKKIATQESVSVQAVSDCLKMLEKIGVVSVKSDGYMKDIFINPGLSHRGTRYREKALMQEFERFDKEVKKDRKNKEAYT